MFRYVRTPPSLLARLEEVLLALGHQPTLGGLVAEEVLRGEHEP